MKLTNSSKKNINYINKLNKNTELFSCPDDTKTDEIMLLFYYMIYYADSFLYENKIQLNPIITNKIIYPTKFSSKPFTPYIEKKIQTEMLTCISYNFMFLNKPIIIHFFTSTKNISINVYNNYVKKMLVWIYVILLLEKNKKNCIENIPLAIYIYHINLEKHLLPKGNILDIESVNTAFTMTCPTKRAEIVIFRKEEWFKVFIHETLHVFGFDFSLINSNEYKKLMSSMFFANTNIKLYETYCEIWARIINVFFCSYFITSNVDEYLIQTKKFLELETIYSLFQANKVLRYMDLTYIDLIQNEHYSKSKYREKTNVLAYYIITSILLTNYQSFLKWCEKNNPDNLINFKKTNTNIIHFCKFIKMLYNTPTYLEKIQYINNVYDKITTHDKLGTTLRMSLTELELY